MKNKQSITSPKNHNHLLLADPKDTETCDLPNEESKIAILGKCNKLQKKKKRKENSTKSGKQYLNKMKSLTKTEKS